MPMRWKFLFALLIPTGYLFLPDIITNFTLLWKHWLLIMIDPRFLFLLCLIFLMAIFISLSEERVKAFFNFCGMEDATLKDNLKNRWEKVCYGMIYGSLGIFVIISCLYKPEWLSLDWIPKELLIKGNGIGRPLLWCFGWGITGLSIVSISDSRRKEGNVQSPFPSYIYFYPSFILVNSLLIFGLLNLLTAEDKVYYPLAAFFSLNLGFWIDTVNFNRLVDGLLNLFGKGK